MTIDLHSIAGWLRPRIAIIRRPARPSQSNATPKPPREATAERRTMNG